MLVRVVLYASMRGWYGHVFLSGCASDQKSVFSRVGGIDQETEQSFQCQSVRKFVLG